MASIRHSSPTAHCRFVFERMTKPGKNRSTHDPETVQMYCNNRASESYSCYNEEYSMKLELFSSHNRL